MTTLGHLVKIEGEMTSPFKFDLSLDYKSLNLFTGKNGSGKSVIMKLSWLATTIYTSSVIVKIKGGTHEALVKECQFLLEATFEDPADFSLKGKFLFENGTLDLVIEEGIIKEVNIPTEDAVDTPLATIFLSSATRTIEDLVRYQRMKQSLGIPLALTNEEDLKKLCDFYKIYDVMAFERLYQVYEKSAIPLTTFQLLVSDYDFKNLFVSTHVQEEPFKIMAITDKGEEYDLSRLSKGEQSLITMLGLSSV